MKLGKAIDRKEWIILKNFIKGMRRIKGRESAPTLPCRNVLLIKMMVRYTKKITYTRILYQAMTSFGKGFALRVGEFTTRTRKPTVKTLKWKHLRFSQSKSDSYLQVTITHSKTNQTHKIEILSRRCICYIHQSICPVHIMGIYKQLYKEFFPYDLNQYVFKQKNGKLVTGYEFRRELKCAFKFAGVSGKFPYWRGHSLRHGEIADLYAAGVHPLTIQKYARHVPGSKVTHTYTKVNANEDADLVHQKFKKYFKSINLEN